MVVFQRLNTFVQKEPCPEVIFFTKGVVCICMYGLSDKEVVDYYQDSKEENSISIGDVKIEMDVIECEGECKGVIVGLAGGPGLPRQNLSCLSVLAEQGYSIVLYDPHNIGGSEEQSAPYSVSTFKHELSEVLSFVKNNIAVEAPIVLFGHSWGSMLTLDYTISSNADFVEGIIAVAPLFNTQVNISIAQTIRAEELSVNELREMVELEAEGDYDNERYRELEEKLDDSRGFKPPIPDFVLDTFEDMNEEMYMKMWGPSEYCLSEGAVLEDWSIQEHLSSISVPTFLITGEDDSFGIHDLFLAKNQISGPCSVEIIEGASHTPMWEERRVFFTEIEEWLSMNV